MNPTSCKHTLTVDFETYYDKEYSLTKQTTQQYILDCRFETLCVAVKLDDEPTQHFTGSFIETELWLKQFPWEEACLVAHNAMFDGAVLLWRYGIMPKAFFCTMMGARPNVVPYSPNGRMGLKYVAETLRLGVKGDEVLRTIGKTRHDVINSGQMAKLLEYCVQDVDLCYAAYLKIVENLPASEQHILSLTTRKFVVPQLILDIDLAHTALKIEEDRRKAHIRGLERRLNTQDLKKVLMSNTLLAQLIHEQGAQPPMKVSLRTGKQTYAFAKTDEGFKAMLDHPDPMIRAIVEARMGVKSTQRETRLKRFLSVAEATTSGWFAVPLLYYGAHTGRFSGLDKLNLQNLPRGEVLRDIIIPPSDKMLVVADLSQIEARITAVLCEQNNLINAFTMGLDVYSMFAADLYGIPVTKESHPDERFIGKQSILGLGFSMSWGRFQEQLKTFGKYIDDSEAKRIVKFYRSQYPQIQTMWYTLNQVIDEALYRGNVMKLGPVIFQKGRVILPNGMQIHYPEMENTDGDFSYNFRGKRKRLYGGALLENIVQALARIILTNAERRLAERGFFAALSVHDELIFCTETEKAEILERALIATLTAEVAWLPRLPLECESSTGISYGSVK